MEKIFKVKPKRHKKGIIYFCLIHDFNYIGPGDGSTVGDYILPLFRAIRKTKS